ncbi:MAG: hypothetical protein PHW60_01875 [Kiritimatiellae bacterium]|nr:hypothetical protein [Kiritimatiellia bacterium]
MKTEPIGRDQRFDWAARRLVPVELKVANQEISLAAAGQSVKFHGRLFELDADAPVEGQWTVSTGPFLTLTLTARASRDCLLRNVRWFAGGWEDTCERAVHRTRLQDNVFFLRKGNISFFLSLDFPYSKIGPAGIAYPPHDQLHAGQDYTCHTLSIGACALSGVRVDEFDRAEIEAVSDYIERRFPPRFERPMLISACINNRLTECREGRVFYSMDDNATLALHPDLLEEEIRLMGEIGVEYYQIFEGMFDWPDTEKTGAALRRMVDVGRKVGVRIGDYANPDIVYCPHYDYAHRKLGHPDWMCLKENGQPPILSVEKGYDYPRYCLGCKEYLDWLLGAVVQHCRAYNEQMICFDMLNLQPCYSKQHGHPGGDLYAQVRGMVRLMEALAAVHPEFMIWTNSGNWLEFMPKLAWWNPNVYLTDPHVRNYAPTLNALKMLGDCRREQMVSVHDRYFVPFRFFTNCEYYAFPRSRVPDTRTFEYSFLQGLAVTPNICPAEVRPFFDRLPAKRREACAAFMRHWMVFAKEHFDVWKHTARVAGAPGIGNAEIYAHIRDNHGYICLINQNPFPCRTQFTLDGAIGLAGGDRFLLSEIYPRKHPIVEQSLPSAAYGDSINCTLPPESVRYLAIEPYTPAAGLRVYGHPAEVTSTAEGYRLALRAPQGETLRLGLVFPSCQAVEDAKAVHVPTVPMYTFPCSARIAAQHGTVALIEVTMPREPAPRALTRWRVTPGEVEVDLPRIGSCRFMGGLISGAYSENLDVQVDLKVIAGDKAGCLPPPPPTPEPSPVSVPCSPSQTFSTVFNLPFIESFQFGQMRSYEDDVVLELAFDDPACVEAIAARLNGVLCEVHRYRYPRKAGWGSYYLELSGNTAPGRIRLEVDVTWRKKTAKPNHARKCLH